jgi:hypothetical protein
LTAAPVSRGVVEVGDGAEVVAVIDDEIVDAGRLVELAEAPEAPGGALAWLAPQAIIPTATMGMSSTKRCTRNSYQIIAKIA